MLGLQIQGGWEQGQAGLPALTASLLLPTGSRHRRASSRQTQTEVESDQYHCCMTSPTHSPTLSLNGDYYTY